MTDGAHDEADAADGADEANEANDDVGGPPGPAAAYARNWLTVLAVDGLVGIAVIALGLYLTIRWNPVGGGFLASLGLGYVLLVIRRGRGWATLRRDAGL